MYFDALVLAAVADELRATVLHGRIQRVVLPSALSLALEVYAHKRRHHVLMSAHPQHARIHLTAHKPSRGVTIATPFLLLLRKYVLGGRIVAIEQPDLERIVVLSIAKDMRPRNPDGDSLDEALDEPVPPTPPSRDDLLLSELIIEPMDRRSNILLVDDANVILESVKRVSPQMSKRVVLPRQPYELPPPQDKRDPRTATAEGIVVLAGGKQREVVRAITGAYRGVSPQVAREAVQRAGAPLDVTFDALDDGRAARVAQHLADLFTAAWQPSLVVQAGEPHAYAPYVVTHLPGTAHPTETISGALDRYYAARERVSDHSQRRDALLAQLDETRKRLTNQLEQITTELARTSDPEPLRFEGEMILAFLATLEPGQTTLEVEGQTIMLAPDRPPLEQAQERFRAYHKARSGYATLTERAATTRYELDALDQIAALLQVAGDYEQIEQLALEAEEQGLLTATDSPRQQRARQKRFRKRKPLRLVSSDGFTVFVGRSATQNAEVTFRLGKPDDLWLHVRSIPGAHVVIRTDGREVPARTLREAAGVAAYFSGARHEAQVDVEVSRRKLVRKIAGAAPGLVTYRPEQTVRVPPLPPWGD